MAAKVASKFPAAVEAEPGHMALTVPEVAWELRCNPSTVWRLIAAGELPSVKVGRRRIVPRDAVEEFITTRCAS
jgi:excisionase family DNA binding protein